MTTIADKVAYVRSQAQTRKHVCHWPGCNTQVPPALWGCKDHWLLLPRDLRKMIWLAYRPGQEIDGKPSKDYVNIARQAQRWIAEHYPETQHDRPRNSG